MSESSSISNVRLMSNKELAALTEKKVTKDNPAKPGDFLYYSKLEDDKHFLAKLGKVGAAKVTQYLSQPEKKGKLTVYKNAKDNTTDDSGAGNVGNHHHHVKRAPGRPKSR